MAGSDGTIWRKLKTKWRRITPHYWGGTKYLLTRLFKNGKRKSRRLHRVILLAFAGSCPQGMEACHNDGNKANNALSNLRWDTRAGNTRDKIRHGSMPRGQKHHKAKLTDATVREARERYAKGGIFFYQLAPLYGVSTAVMRKAVQRELWKHIT
jgi:hypothetical protein